MKNRAERLEKHPQTNKPTNTNGEKKKYLPVTDYKPIKKEVAKNG